MERWVSIHLVAINGTTGLMTMAMGTSTIGRDGILAERILTILFLITIHHPQHNTSTHGTHVAGIASAVTNNHIGISGIGYNTKIMAIKTTSDNDYLENEGGSQGPFVIFGDEGIVFAADHGAKIINCSWGGLGFSQAEQDIITYATQHGALVVAAAGNDHTGEPEYPAGYDNVISVAATNYTRSCDVVFELRYDR